MKNIFIPTDLSDSAKISIRYAIILSKKSKSNLFFYNVSKGLKSEMETEYFDFVNQTFLENNTKLNKFSTEIVIGNGDFSIDFIKIIIAEHSIDLIVLSEYHNTFYKTFFNNHLSEMINKVNCPILAIPRNCNSYNINRIGFASELFDFKRRIKMIIPFAKLFNATIDVFHVFPISPQLIDVTKINKEKVLNRIRKEHNYEKINFCFIKTDNVNELEKGILKFLIENNPDILVISNKSRGLIDKLTTDSTGLTWSVPILAYNKKSTLKLS